MRPLSDSSIKTTARILLNAGVIFILLCLFSASRLQAGEAELYDEAPKDSAFIRLINLTSAAIELEIGNTIIAVTDHCYASDYVYLPAGEYMVSNQAGNWRGQLEPDRAYSLIVAATGARLEPEQRFSSARKGLLAVYNFSPNSISVKTTGTGKPVFAEMARGTKKARQVNPIKIQLTVYVKHEGSMDAASIIFQAGVISSLLVCHDGSKTVVNWSDN